jgi:transposase
MPKIIEILRLKYDSRLSHQKIALAVGLSKGAIGKYVSIASAVGIRRWPLPDGVDEAALERRLFPSKGEPQSRYVEPDWFVVHQELKRKGVTLIRLWAEHEERVGERAHRYTQFSQRYRAWKLRQKRSMRQHHRAGEKVFIDHCGPTVPVIDRRTGEIRQAQIFVAVLGSSSYTFAEATWTQGLEDWIGSNARMLEFFGGVPELLIPDNLRSASTKASRYEPVVNETYLEFARHYATAVLPTRPRKPKDKAKAEAGVLLVERWILAAFRHHEFFSLNELNQAIAKLLVSLNERPFQRRTESRLDLFNMLDRPALRPLPPNAYEYAIWRHAKVAPDYHVQFDGCYFSVPHSLVGQKVDLRITGTVVEVLSRSHRVATHQRDTAKRFHTLTEHMPSSHRRHAQWSPARFVSWATDIGVATTKIVRHLLENRPHPEHGYRSCLGILNLTKQYGKPRVEAACARALAAGSMTATSVRSILKQGLDQIPMEEPEQQQELLLHENVRGAESFK